MTPDVMNLLFALAGAALGWFVRYRLQRDVPPELSELLAALEKTLSQRKERATTDLVARLNDVAKSEPKP